MVLIITCTTSGFHSAGFPLFHRLLTGNATAWTTNACEKVVIIPEVMVFLVVARLWCLLSRTVWGLCLMFPTVIASLQRSLAWFWLIFLLIQLYFHYSGREKHEAAQMFLLILFLDVDKLFCTFFESLYSHITGSVCLEYVCSGFSAVCFYADWNVLKYRLVKIFPLPSHHQVKNEFLEVTVLKEPIKHISCLRGR